jgi:capsular polysaccharide biosynthesis protein
MLASIFVVLALLGSGYLVFVSQKPMYSASSLVLLPGSAADSGQPSGNDMSTDSQIAVSAAILGPVGQKIDPSLSLTTLRKRVHAGGTATNVLQITALAATPAQAEAFANLVATKLVAFVSAAGSATNATGLVALRAEAAQLTKQINDVNGEITSITNRIAQVGASSSAGQQDTSLLTALNAQQSQATLQLDSVNSEIAVAQLGSSAANAGTEVIQKATIATKPSIVGSIIKVILGGLVGLALGSVIIVLLYRGDRRLRRRDQLAEAVGVPVVLSLATSRRSKNIEWTEFLETYQPSSVDRWRVRKSLRDLALWEATPSTLLVLSLPGDADSLIVAPQIALTVAAQGTSVSLNVVGQDERVVDLRAAVERYATSGHLLRSNLELQAGTSPFGLTIISMVVDPSMPQPQRIPDAVTVLAVSPGSATGEELARTAIAAADRDQAIGGLVVTNPDPDDFTTGRLFDGSSPQRVIPYRVPVRAGRG